MKRCEVSLLIQSHQDFSSSCGFRLLDAKFGEILASKLFHTPIFNGSLGVQGWNPIQVPALLKPWPLPHSWSKEEGMVGRLGKYCVIWAACLISAVLLLSVFGAALAGSSIGKIKPINTPLALAFPVGAGRALGCRGAGWWMLLRLGQGGGQTQFHSVKSETLEK